MTTSIAIGNYKPVQKRLIVCCDGMLFFFYPMLVEINFWLIFTGNLL